MTEQTQILVKNGPLKILAVDDNPAALYATTRILRSAGYEVIEATTGAAALRAAPEADLLVLDVNLPDIDGFEICRILRRMPQTEHLPVVHLSATFVNQADFVQGFNAGADSYLTRPVEAPVLIATVRTLLFARHADALRRGLDAKLHTMFRLAPVGIALLDGKLRYESVNPAFCRMSEYSAEELIGQPYDRFLKPNAEAEDALRVDTAEARLVEFYRKGGAIVEMEWKIAEADRSGSRVLVASDVGERRRIENAMREADRRKDLFIATLAHELRNPLAPIRAAAQIVSSTKVDAQQVRSATDIIQRQVTRMALLLDDLLDIARITQGKLKLRLESVGLSDIVDAAVEAARPHLDSKNHNLDICLPPGQLTLYADPLRLSQVLSNLLTNAAKYTDRGGHIALIGTVENSTLCLAVKDDGIGIAPKSLNSIFEMFSQIEEGSARSAGGLGIGLALVKGITELHGGHIEVRSEGTGLGSTFTLYLPLTGLDRARGCQAAAPASHGVLGCD